MAATERRRFVTRTDVEDAAKAGLPVVLGARDVITDEAAQRARDLAVTIERRDGGAPAPAGRTAPGGSTAPPADRGALRRAVRSAVVAELGHEPAGLDAAIDKVLARPRT